VNEAITNAIKYAFPQKRKKNEITVALTGVGDDLSLLIADNGVGMDLNNDTGKWGSLGLTLIRGLCQDLEATFEIKNDSGTQLRFKFSKNLKHNTKMI